MTEEIITDGVDVAGCEHYTTMEDCDGIHDLCEQLDDYCSIKKDCYYKQLKRLEQENKKLKEEIQFHNKENSNLLAEKNATQIAYDEIREVRERYRSALEEIKAMINHPDHRGLLNKIEDRINEVLK